MKKKNTAFWMSMVTVGLVITGLGLATGLVMEVFFLIKTVNNGLGIGYFFDMSKISAIVGGVIVAFGGALSGYAQQKAFGFKLF